ncbi:uncharacterized protein LOC121303810 isoform X2 [Polyodon spathula]|nr:uncharacterized protein LOC121303810 isoform X2 [Polyodon spathula]
MARALKDGMQGKEALPGGNPVNCGGAGGGSSAVRMESLRRRSNHPLMTGYQQCRRSLWTHSGPDEMGTQPPLTQQGTPAPLCSAPHQSSDACSRDQQRSPSLRDVHALPDMLQRNQRPLADMPQNCSPASSDQGEEEDLSGMVAEQLRIIGDEMNEIYQQRRNEAQGWLHWGAVWRGLYNFISQTLNTGYLPGLR